MKILVCISKTPDTTAKIAFTEGNTKFDENGVQWIINPYDEWYALVRAIELKEKDPNAIIHLITVGSADAEPIIRKALALGGDEAIRIDSNSNDSFYVAKQIAAIAKEGSYDIIFTGKETIDYNSAHNLMTTQFSPIAINPNANASNLPSYVTLNQNLNTYKDVLSTYKQNNPDPINENEKDVKNNNSVLSNRDPTTYLKPRHNEILRLRSDLDQKLMDLNNTSNGLYSSSKLQMDSNIYITIMWTTLASAIVYYSFFHL